MTYVPYPGIDLAGGSVFSGIGGADLGLELAGVESRFQIENASYPRRVLRARWPEVRRLLDVRKALTRHVEPVNLLHGGFPCQDVSVAGRRAGLAGERSSLFFQFLRLIRTLHPRWVIIENVPGLLSSNRGRDMDTIVRSLEECGYGWAYRVLDAQYFGLAQRRRRVLIVGCFGDAARAAAVLFEPERGGGHPRADREAGTDFAYPLTTRAGARQDPTTDTYIAATLNSGGGNGGFRTEPGEHLVTAPLTASYDASEDGTGRGLPLVPHPVLMRMREGKEGGGKGPLLQVGKSGTLATGNDQTLFVIQDARAISTKDQWGLGYAEGDGPMCTLDATSAPAVVFSDPRRHDDQHRGGMRELPSLNASNNDLVAYALRGNPGGVGQAWNMIYVPATAGPVRTNERNNSNGLTDARSKVYESAGVRKLTPLECERLQGFPDGWTCLCGALGDTRSCRCPDAPRYRALGNAIAVPVLWWIGKRIVKVERALALSLKMSRQQVALLDGLVANGGRAATMELAVYSGTLRESIYRAMQRLEERGLVERTETLRRVSGAGGGSTEWTLSSMWSEILWLPAKRVAEKGLRREADFVPIVPAEKPGPGKRRAIKRKGRGKG